MGPNEGGKEELKKDEISISPKTIDNTIQRFGGREEAYDPTLIGKVESGWTWGGGPDKYLTLCIKGNT